MNIFKKAVDRYFPKTTGSTNNDTEKRTQFNIYIKPGIKMAVRLLAVDYGVPLYAVSEHCLQIGSAYLFLALNDPKEKERMGQHLVSAHLLGKHDANELDYLVSSKPIFLNILRSDVDRLRKEYRRLEYLVFKDEHMPEAKWRYLVHKTRQNLELMFCELIVKIDRLTEKEDPKRQQKTSNDVVTSEGDGTVEEDFTNESDSIEK